jgi:hypothetical protein
MLNMQGIFERGYRLVQCGRISFFLTDTKNTDAPMNVVVEFEVDEGDESILFVHERLLKEIDYHIRGIEEEDGDYFSDCENEEEINHTKTKYLDELKLIGDILR